MKSVQNYLIWLVISMSFWGCSKEEVIKEVPPVDLPPVIRRIAPSRPSGLHLPGTTVELVYSLADNEQLKRWVIEEIRLQNIRYFDTVIIRNGQPRDTIYSKGDTVSRSIYLDQSLSGSITQKTINYRVPSLDPLSRIDLIAQVYDIRDQKDPLVARYAISIDLAIRDSLAQFFAIASYNAGDTLYSAMVNPSKSIFNLLGRRYANPALFTDQEIAEASTPILPFSRQLISPAYVPEEPVFVVLKPAIFNYEELTYATMRSAFRAFDPVAKTPPLEVGDVVLYQTRSVNTNYRNWPHYAALKVVRIVDNGQDDRYIVFQYKRSEDL